MAEGDSKKLPFSGVDATLWAHVIVQMLAFGILMPLGIVFGMAQSRWHVPTQVSTISLAVLGCVLGYSHGGREFHPGNFHSLLAPVLMCLFFAQAAMGTATHIRINKPPHQLVRKISRVCHGVLGKVFPIAVAAQMLLGGITLLGFQCSYSSKCIGSGHFVFGIILVTVSILSTILLITGGDWLRRRGKSQEWWEGSAMAIWGVIQFITSHRWGETWYPDEWQHIMMGLVWLVAGILGTFLSRDGNGMPRRNLFPALVLVLTGLSMNSHHQRLRISNQVHRMLGYTMVAAGASRVIEICFILKDNLGPRVGGRIHSWSYLPVFFICASGFLVIGASNEQIDLLDEWRVDFFSYMLLMYSLALICFLFTLFLIELYVKLVNSRPARFEPLWDEMAGTGDKYSEDEVEG